MAVALLRKKLNDRGISAVVISAGTLGIQGRRAAVFARQAIAEWNDEMSATIDEHRSQGLSPALMQMADDLVVMAPRHAQFVRQRASADVVKRLVPLWEYVPGDLNLKKIPDPVGQDAEVFRHCRNLIDQCLDRWLEVTFGPREVSAPQ